MKKILHHIETLSWPCMLLLCIGLPSLICLSVVSIFRFYIAIKIDPLAAVRYYQEIFEVIFVSIDLILAGAFLFDLVSREAEKE